MSAVAPRWTTWQRTAHNDALEFDRSPKMINAAASRNAARRVGEGRAEFLVARLEELDLVVLAVRAGLFDREPERARALVAPWPAPGGRLLTFFDPPSHLR